jgi:hypothetical protein
MMIVPWTKPVFHKTVLIHATEFLVVKEQNAEWNIIMVFASVPEAFKEIQLWNAVKWVASKTVIAVKERHVIAQVADVFPCVKGKFVLLERSALPTTMLRIADAYIHYKETDFLFAQRVRLHF